MLHFFIALAAVALYQFNYGTAKNIALSKHQIHHHLAWVNTKSKHNNANDKYLGAHGESWANWKQAFNTIDEDRKGNIRYQQINDLFREHYNIHHRQHIEDDSRDDFTLANSRHFIEEATQFQQWLPQDHPHIFTYEQLHDLMIDFMDERHKERAGLMEYAQHIYKSDL